MVYIPMMMNLVLKFGYEVLECTMNDGSVNIIAIFKKLLAKLNQVLKPKRNDFNVF